MSNVARQLLRVSLVVLLLGTVMAQALVPVFAAEKGVLFPEVAGLVVAYSVAAILVIACGQMVLLAIWRLLTFIDRGQIFTPRALRWVDVIMVSGGVAAALSAGVMIHLLFVVGLGGPGVVLGLAASVAVGLRSCCSWSPCGTCSRRPSATGPSSTR